jgi:hypothetical protein
MQEDMHVTTLLFQWYPSTVINFVNLKIHGLCLLKVLIHIECVRVLILEVNMRACM